MTPLGAVLFRPMTAPLSRKVAVILVLGLLSLLFLGNVAVGQLSTQLSFARPLPVQAIAAVNENGLPSILKLYDRESAGIPASDVRATELWIAYLKAHPEARINITVDSSLDLATEDSRRVASLVQLLSSSGIDPHRVRLIALPPFETASTSSNSKASSLNDVLVVEIKLE
jgi:hypothetical protein